MVTQTANGDTRAECNDCHVMGGLAQAIASLGLEGVQQALAALAPAPAPNGSPEQSKRRARKSKTTAEPEQSPGPEAAATPAAQPAAAADERAAGLELRPEGGETGTHGE